MILTATVMPSDRANSSASKFFESVTRFRKRFSPSSSIFEAEEHGREAEPSRT